MTSHVYTTIVPIERHLLARGTRATRPGAGTRLVINLRFAAPTTQSGRASLSSPATTRDNSQEPAPGAGEAQRASWQTPSGRASFSSPTLGTSLNSPAWGKVAMRLKLVGSYSSLNASSQIV